MGQLKINILLWFIFNAYHVIIISFELPGQHWLVKLLLKSQNTSVFIIIIHSTNQDKQII